MNLDYVVNVGGEYSLGSVIKTLPDKSLLVGGQAVNQPFLANYSSTGQLQWSVVGSYGGSGTTINYLDAVVASDGSIFAIGRSSLNSNAVVQKYSATGSLQWTRSFDSNQQDDPYSIAIDDQNNIYVAGLSSGNLGGQQNLGSGDGFLISLDPDGQDRWIRLFGGSGDDTATAVTISNGQIVVAGMTRGNVGFDGVQLINRGGLDAFSYRFSSDGSRTSVDQWGSSSDELVTDIVSDSFGNFYVAGYVRYFAGFVRKYSSSNLLEWSKSFPASGGVIEFTGIDVNGSGSLIAVSGWTNGSIPSLEEFTFTDSYDGFVITLSANGEVISSSGVGGTNMQILEGVTFLDDNSLFAVGYSRGGLENFGISTSDGNDPILVSWNLSETSPVVPATPTYSISSSSSVNEGSSASFTVATTNVAAGTSLSYSIGGVSTSDLTSGSLSGTTTVGSNGQATISIPVKADSLTEGPETLTVTVQGQTASVVINDTSLTLATPTYSVSSSSSSVNEGSSVTFTVATTNVASGTSLSYSLYGVSSSDVSGRSLSGTTTVGSNGQATIFLPVAADSLTEGSETLTVSVQGQNASVTINDTSLSLASSTYFIASNSFSVNEGGVASFSLSTTNVNPGTSVSYSIGGVSSSDIGGLSLSGSAVVDSIGRATISVPIAADSLTEGTETLTVTVQNQLASVSISDTSLSVATPTYSLSASGSSVTTGRRSIFTLSTTQVSPASGDTYTSGPVSATDNGGGT